MNGKRVVFRADADKKIGYGHFIRSLALADYLKEDFSCYFTTYNSVEYNPTDYQLKEINKVCEYIPIKGYNLEEANELFLNELESRDIVVLDNYYYSTHYQQRIKDKGCKLVCIDDMHDRHMVCDLLITVCPLKKEDFSIEPYTTFVGGIKWAFLRNPFLKPKKILKNKARNSKVVIAMGGADPFNLTDKMVRIVHKIMPYNEINVIVGDTVCISDETLQLGKVHVRLNADEIVDLFDSSDIGIFPASTICMEAFSRKLPIMVGYYVENQEEFYHYGVKHKLFSPLGNLLDNEDMIMNRMIVALDNKRPLLTKIDFKNQKKKMISLFKGLE